MKPNEFEAKTEQVHPDTRELDKMDTRQIVQVMNEEDRRIAGAIKPILPDIARAIDRITDTIRHGGRLFYIGAGTSGRLGVLDASECPPTFGTDPNLVQGIIAGGDHALRFPVEGAEDSPEAGKQDLIQRSFSDHDFLVGIAASGNTPYVRGALKYAHDRGAATAAITCNPGSPAGRLADIPLEVDTGPEILMGSTRLKAGTAQKMILNMLSTGTMVRLGKTYQNLMVDLIPSNDKLCKRARRIVEMATGSTPMEVKRALAACGGETKTAIVMLLTGCTTSVARERLRQAEGRVRDALV
ncbi:N-acetylmuramic acid 6-phosphate etherase [Desmospora profundinema]|uniref:N-acetylmuramic acid 6-phosphate etherase n=1 Tax=Desmospora profundinema TaxID=1571184 RepID=A0ABU1IKV8_9BACL|nr:N-acetylmuramic acid 6-phosphate etherase [Desmospora profundinema]MDR6225409.1 N-acetylmuramic acid 6-phosphate etherase [Desmospora profundinema]